MNNNTPVFRIVTSWTLSELRTVKILAPPSWSRTYRIRWVMQTSRLTLRRSARDRFHVSSHGLPERWGHCLVVSIVNAYEYLLFLFFPGCNTGYAFVNFIHVQDLLRFAQPRLGEKWGGNIYIYGWLYFDAFHDWNMFSSEKVLQMSYANYPSALKGMKFSQSWGIYVPGVNNSGGGSSSARRYQEDHHQNQSPRWNQWLHSGCAIY